MSHILNLDSSMATTTHFTDKKIEETQGEYQPSAYGIHKLGGVL